MQSVSASWKVALTKLFEDKNFPDTHEVQTGEPRVSAYVPISHTLQSDSESWAAVIKPSSGRNFPTKHGKHEEEPSVAEYFPAEQFEQYDAAIDELNLPISQSKQFDSA